MFTTCPRCGEPIEPAEIGNAHVRTRRTPFFAEGERPPMIEGCLVVL